MLYKSLYQKEVVLHCSLGYRRRVLSWIYIRLISRQKEHAQEMRDRCLQVCGHWWLSQSCPQRHFSSHSIAHHILCRIGAGSCVYWTGNPWVYLHRIQVWSLQLWTQRGGVISSNRWSNCTPSRASRDRDPRCIALRHTGNYQNIESWWEVLSKLRKLLVFLSCRRHPFRYILMRIIPHRDLSRSDSGFL